MSHSPVVNRFSLTNDLPEDGPDGAAVNFVQAPNEGDVDEADEYLYDGYGSKRRTTVQRSM